jgi:hypothetical protein
MRTRHNRSPNQLLILYSDINAPPCDYNNIDNILDDALIDNDEVDVNPIVCQLTPNQLECFIHHINPLSLSTPILSLKDSYYTALTALLNIAEMDL